MLRVVDWGVINEMMTYKVPVGYMCGGGGKKRQQKQTINDETDETAPNLGNGSPFFETAAQCSTTSFFPNDHKIEHHKSTNKQNEI